MTLDKQGITLAAFNIDIMNEEDKMELEAWRRSHLGDEPIYCAAPSPSNPDDIVCLGSDEELDNDAKVKRRLRYETQAIRYLRGKPVRLLSASLRGPFDRASGWQNPWLPKQPAVKKSVLKASRLSTKPISAITRRIRKDLNRLVRQGGTTPSTDNSLLCHLPSPESNRELQVCGNPPEIDKHSRIQAWAKEVSIGATLEKDTFWAPSQMLHKESDESNRKRPAAKEWLRERSSKRKKVDGSQTAGASSTPTPILSTQSPARSTFDSHTRKPTLIGKVASQSFELATPSSTANQSSLEIQRGQVETSAKHEMIPSQDKPPNSLRGLSEDSQYTETIVNEIPDPTLLKDGQGDEEASNSRANNSQQISSDVINQEPQKYQEEDTTFESYLDQSFHYKARPAKQMTPITGPGAPITSNPPKLTQTVTSGFPIHENTVSASANQIEQQTLPLQKTTISERPNGTVHILEPLHDSLWEQDTDGTIDDDKAYPPIPPGRTGQPSKNQNSETGNHETSRRNEIISHMAIAETKSSTDQIPSNKDSSPMCADSVSTSLLARKASALHTEDEITQNESFGAMHGHPRAPCGNAVLPSHTTDIACPIKLEPLTDEEATLVNGSIDSDRNIPPEAELSTIHHTINGPDINLIPAAEPQYTMHGVIEKATREAKSDVESKPTLASLSHMEPYTTQVVGNFQEKPGAAEDKSGILVSIEEVPREDAPVQATLLAPPEVVTRRSPWVYDLPPGADLTPDYVKSEPPDDESLRSPCPSHFTPFGSQASVRETSRLRMSQQSPWTEEFFGPTGLDEQQHYLSTAADTTLAGQTPITADSMAYRTQSPWAETNMKIMSHPEYPSISPTAAALGESLRLQPQAPMVATRFDNRSSEHYLNSLATPPRMTFSPVRTPDLERSIKPFATLNTPSPKRRSRQSMRQFSSSGRIRGILSSNMRSNPWNNDRSNRRVSFASLPNDGYDDNSPPASNSIRVASPPVQVLVNPEDGEDVSDAFQKHFDIMKQRANGENAQLRFQPRLLPSSSQRKPISPTVGAMAEAFQQADAHIAHIVHTQEDRVEEAGDSIDQEMLDVGQSPWQKESQGADDVADVLNNLDDFLNV